MLKKRIGIIGIGTVGKPFLVQLKKSLSYIKANLELDIKISKVCDINPEIKKLSGKLNIPFVSRAEDLISDPQIDIVIELIGGLHPAKEYVISALYQGKDVITANKALLANYGAEIFNLAYKLGRTVKFEAAVAGGVPLIKNVSEVLRFGKIRNVYGILNGTTNFILSQMSRYSKSFSEVLEEAKQKGFAEKDSSLDINGTDSLHKISILCFLCFGAFVKLKDVIVEGIDKITLADILYAQELGFSIKLLAIAKKDTSKIEVRVHPTLISQDHPLAKTGGVLNAIFINTDIAGNFLLSGLGAGGKSTSLSVLSDVLSICNQKNPWVLKGQKKRSFFRRKEDLSCRYYLRFQALDRPGVLAKISKILADLGISIASVTQKERGLPLSKSKFVPIVMLTHKAKESSIVKARQRIDKLSDLKPPIQIIRIESL
ncbi:MAG: homoserine dehydrogenase [Candidatus Omnitrophica bacterium]|nr:homoserine dehydrogenase [Candidatus Omnitrophota bacterium]